MKQLIIILLFFILVLKGPIVLGNNLDIKIQTEKVILEVKKKELKSGFDKYFGYFKDILGPTVALIGILITLPLFRRKLIENHITVTLNKIQEANSNTQIYNQKLIDKYIPLTYNDFVLSKQDIQNALKDIINAYQIAQKGSSDVATLMFYLKITIQNTIIHYDDSLRKGRFSESFIVFIIEILEYTNFYATQVVQVPKSSKTEKYQLVNKSLRKYVTYSHVTRYKYFKMGIINDVNSAHYTHFYSKIIKVNEPLLMKSAFQIFRKPNAVAKLIFVNNIYAPSVLEFKGDADFGPGTEDLFLIGFSIQTQLVTDQEEQRNVVDLVYSNVGVLLNFIDALSYDKFKLEYKDSWIPDSNFDLTKSISMSKTGIESFRLRYDKIYLEKMFLANRRKIKRKLKK